MAVNMSTLAERSNFDLALLLIYSSYNVKYIYMYCSDLFTIVK